MKTIKTLLGAIGIILLIDFATFLAWAVSGQIPVDGFFLGGLTRYIINLIIG